MNIKYCSVCGRKLLERKISDGYNPENGNKKLKIYMVCPKYSLWYWALLDMWHSCIYTMVDYEEPA